MLENAFKMQIAMYQRKKRFSTSHIGQNAVKKYELRWAQNRDRCGCCMGGKRALSK